MNRSGNTPAELIERDKIIVWLRRRADMCLPYPSWLEPTRRMRAKAMAGTFLAAARLIALGVHWNDSLEGETDTIRAALTGEQG